MATASLIQTGLLRACPFAALLVSLSASPQPAHAVSNGEPARGARNIQEQLLEAQPARKVTITYTTHNGHQRNAYVQLPHGYGPGNNPAIPLVISPHGRGVDGKINTRRWGNLPTIGRFAVVNPDGYGRVLKLHSWGFRGQIDDLARMADIVEEELRWLHIDRTRLYAVGASMGAHETLLLAGRYPGLLAGAVAVDGPADFALQYRNFPRLVCDRECLARGWGHTGLAKQRLARREIGGTPTSVPEHYAERSPLSYARTIAESCVPVQIWWSRTDDVVLEPSRQSGRMVNALRAMNPHAPVDEFVGSWAHTEVMHHETDLPKMLAGLGLLPPTFAIERVGATHDGPAPEERCDVGNRG
jgi:dipeptidyl aminopeptidase/acylaminoacyl peptidase